MTNSQHLDFRAVGFNAAGLVLAFVYVWLRVEPELEYVTAAPLFRLSWAFFQPFTDRPGGLLDYATAFLAQFNCRNWLGAAVFTGLLALVLWEGHQLLSRLTRRRPGLTPWVAVWLLLVARQRLDAVALSLVTGLALSLGLALIYTALPGRWPALRIAVCWVAAAALFYAAGLGPCGLFVLLGVAAELGLRRSWRTALGCAWALFISPLLGRLGLPELNWAEVLNPWGRGTWLALPAGLHLFYPVAVAVLRLLPPAGLPARPPAPPRSRGPARQPVRQGWREVGWLRRPGLRRVAQGALVAAAAVTVWAGFDQPRQTQRALEYYAARNDHARLLKLASRLESLDAAAEVRLHRALFYAGRLLDELFAFSHQRLWTLFPELRHGPEACRAQSQTLLELGQVNLAEHFAHEALEVEGERPDLLRLLATVNVLKGRPQAARVFLHALRQVPFHRAWAQRWLRRLETDPRLEDEPELRLIRSRMVNTDLPHNEMAVASFCRQLLHANPTNQMAFEYLMAQYLLDRQLDGLIKELPRLETFQYSALPRHLQEAIVLYQHLHDGASVELGSHQIAPEIRQRFQAFARMLADQSHQTPNGQRWLAQQFGDTYWHYYFFPKQVEPRAPEIRATESS